MIKRGSLAVLVFLILVLTVLGNAESPYSVDFDLRNMAGFDDNVITAEDIVAYIQDKYHYSPMLVEDGIGECFINAGQGNGVNPAFLVATAEWENKFGTIGWAKSHPECHNTFGWAITDSGPIGGCCADSWCEMIHRVSYNIAHGKYYYSRYRFTVSQVREQYATKPYTENIARYMNDLYTFSINRQTNEFDVPAVDALLIGFLEDSQATQQVTLTLYVHVGRASGPIIQGARVTGQDSSSNSFEQTTDSSGKVTITGCPGTWSFSASADGYETKIWDQEIIETDTKDAYLQKVSTESVPAVDALSIGFPEGSQTHPSQVLSPVTGDLELIGPSGSCSNTKWCFNQHQTGGHIPDGGICQAEDTYAWDANLNTPTWDSDQGEPVYAVAQGVICQTYGGCKNADDLGSYGQVLIEHSYEGNTWWSGYLHLDNIQVTRGQSVTENTIIGYVSDTGADNNHLHFVVYTDENIRSRLKSFDAQIQPRSGPPQEEKQSTQSSVVGRWDVKSEPEVIFPDPNLEAALRTTILKPDGSIYIADLEQIESISAIGCYIKDITGLEYCTNLQRLELTSSQITDVSPLSSLTNLKVLDLSFNQIADVSPLKGLTNLEELRLGGGTTR